MHGSYHSHRDAYNKGAMGCGKKAAPAACSSEEGYGHNAGFILFFIILAFLIFFILAGVKPDYVMKRDHHDNTTGSIDLAKTIGWSLLTAFVIVIIVWALWKFADVKGGC